MKKMIAPLVLWVLGAVCIIAFKLIGAEVTPDGQVIEPFFLNGIGILMILVGMVWGITALIIGAVKAGRAKKAKK